MKKNQIRAAIMGAKRAPQRIVVDGIECHFRPFSLGEANALLDFAKSQDADRSLKLVARILVDEDGESVFDADLPSDIEILRNGPLNLQKLINAAFSASGMDEAGQEAAGKN